MNNSNRVILLKVSVRQLQWFVGLLMLALLAADVWWIGILPSRAVKLYGRFTRPKRVEQLFNQAVKEYETGDYPRTIGTLEQVLALDSDLPKGNLLLGWSHWRLGQAQPAETYFSRALRLDPAAEQAKLGLAFASLALQKATVALPLLQELAQKHPEDNEIQMALGEAYVQSGQNLTAAMIYRAVLQRNPEDQAAHREFLGLYGYPNYRPDLSLTSSTFQRPEQPEIYFRTRGDFFQVRVGKEWRNIFSAGVNLGPARPGEFPSTASRDFSTYLDWLKQIAAMNTNTVRLYTILPPAFYQAFKVYNETARSPLWLLQEVWLEDEAENLYDAATEQRFQKELSNVIDLLHGQADVPYRRGHHYGIYTADVSRHVLALAVGQEMEPRHILATNRKNPSSTSYKGHYVSLTQGTPSEAWFARMCDFAANYEVEKYNAQRPLTVVNWPPLDPMTHPAESTYEEEIRIRKKLGELVPDVGSPIVNDADVVSLDIVKFQAESEFVAGLFALYHVYPHWPDFLLYEPSYALAQDEEGTNRYLGYLRELKKAHPNFPLLIGEYGISTSMGIAHLHPQGWNNGGLTEKRQAELLVRFTKNILETRCAGAVVFEWQDEWFKHVHDNNTAEFEMPWDRNPLWMNAMDPEKNFGIVGYQPVTPVPLLRGKREDWESATALFSSKNGEPGAGISPGELRAVYAMSDFAYIYLRLDVASGAIDWNRWNYWIALNTLPGQSGSRLLPEIGIRVNSGANFLIQLASPFSGRILIAENYNPNQPLAIAGRFGITRMARKSGMKVALADSVPFQEIVIEVNPPRYVRDGRIFPALDFKRSPLPYGTADRTQPEFSSHALWYADPQQGMIELRLPWGLLLMMDPSNQQAFGGTDEHWIPVPKASTGISISAFALRIPETGKQEPKVVTSSLPPVRDGNFLDQAPVYAWQGWNQVQVRPYFKPSYFALQKVFAELADPPPQPHDSSRAAGDSISR